MPRLSCVSAAHPYANTGTKPDCLLPLPTVAIVGRPNTGKSTLFNRILKRQLAVVDAAEGVTRDRHYAETEWDGVPFILIDTGGYTPPSESAELAAAVREQTLIAASEADILLFVADAQAGSDANEHELARIVQRRAAPVLFIANKIDDITRIGLAWEMPSYGLGDVHPLSARTGFQVAEMLDALTTRIRKMKPVLPEASAPEALSLAIIGAPNSGKSTLVNRLAGEDRMVVSDLPGTTRDAIDTIIQYHGERIRLVDTAGLRKRRLGQQGIEFYSTLRALNALQRCDVAVILIDASQGLTQGDIRLAQQAADAGTGVIVAVNKWDLAALSNAVPDPTLKSDPDRLADLWAKEWTSRASKLTWVPLLFTSGLTGRKAVNIIASALKVKAERSRRIPTPELNATITPLLQRSPPPAVKGRMVRLKYAAQVGTNPPSFAFFSSHANTVGDAYIRFAERLLRESYGFIGVPLRISFRNK